MNQTHTRLTEEDALICDVCGEVAGYGIGDLNCCQFLCVKCQQSGAALPCAAWLDDQYKCQECFEAGEPLYGPFKKSRDITYLFRLPQAL